MGRNQIWEIYDPIWIQLPDSCRVGPVVCGSVAMARISWSNNLEMVDQIA
jgi:hypothetical protein